MSDTTDLLAVLSASAVFGGLPRRQLKTIARYSRAVSVPSGTRLVAEGDAGSEFCIVVSGGCRVERRGVTLRTLEPGDSFGEISVIDGEPRTATVTALADTDLVVLSQPDFDHALKVAPDLGRALLTQLCAQIRRLDTEAD
jgi:CRP-like cAMP-binding protein